MARISGVDLPREKRIEIGLTYVYGIGRVRASKILEEAGVNPDTRVKDLTDEEVAKIAKVIDADPEHLVEGYEIGIKDKMKSVIRTVQSSMDKVAQPPRVEKAGSDISKSQTYTYGDINVHIDSVNSEREARVVAEQIEFLRRQQSTGRGGNA